MHCTDTRGHHRGTGRANPLVALAALAVLAGCAAPRRDAPAPVATTRPTPTAPAQPGARPSYRSWEEFRVVAAKRLVAANPNGTYLGAVAEPLLAIPVLEVELNGDGSVRNIAVMRHPSQARETTQMAIDAVRRAAPFGEVAHLPRPWKYTETFLFDDSKRFKPMSLDR